MLNNHQWAILLLGCLLSHVFFACKTDASLAEKGYQNTLTFSPGQEDQIRLACIEAEDNTLIQLEAGIYEFEKLSLQGPLNNIAIVGKGKEETIVDFGKQASGGEGFRVENVNQLLIKDIQFRESKGDLLKIKEGKDIQLLGVATVWEGEPEISNGGYGIYPVLCEDVVIKDCYARGASDAGVYVGQTNRAKVSHSLVEYCVAGIEIENTLDAEVWENEMRHNTGGLLIFDHPGLKYDGKNTRAHHNNIHDNNYRNFAPAANSATGVGNLAPGTGILILRTSDVEVFENTITNNNTMSVGVISYATVDPQIFTNKPDFFPNPQNVTIRNNTYGERGAFPEGAYEHELAQLVVQLHEGIKAADPRQEIIQHILFDGIVAGEGANPHNLCIEEEESVSFLNMDVANGFAQPSFDRTAYQCAQL
ncbi:MAG: parallel beta-helix domain-containing protein [Bacteroidota bacterium]